MKSFKRNELSLSEKIDLILNSDGKTQCKLAELYGIGRNQVGKILKTKDEIFERFKSNKLSNKKRLLYHWKYEDVDMATWDWIQQARESGMNINGPIIQANALRIAIDMGIDNFKASNGWLNRFKKRHNLNATNFNGDNQFPAASNSNIQGELDDENRNYQMKELSCNKDITDEFSSQFVSKEVGACDSEDESIHCDEYLACELQDNSTYQCEQKTLPHESNEIQKSRDVISHENAIQIASKLTKFCHHHELSIWENMSSIENYLRKTYSHFEFRT